jgi:hypothetical protein
LGRVCGPPLWFRAGIKGRVAGGSIVLAAANAKDGFRERRNVPQAFPDSTRMSSITKSLACLGFLTVVEHAELGLLGGYLLLNAAGRPLEFHCTAPVKASRAQEILYGATLKPYLYGEQIGQTLLAKSKQSPIVVFTDCEPMLAVRDHTHLPVALVSAMAGSSGDVAFRLGQNEVLLPAPYAADEQVIRAHWPAQADQLDLSEPFTRIREALDEAQQTARAA